MSPTQIPASLLAVLALALPAVAAADSYTIDPRHTFPSFEVSHVGFSTQRGRFDRTSGKIELDPAKGTGSIHVVVDADSIDTGLQELEDRLRKEDFFHTARYPTITYEADRLVFEGGKPVLAEGRLTLLGITKAVPLKIEHFHCGVHPISKKEVCGADAVGSIKRSEFGMTAFLPAVGDEVKLLIQVEGFKE
ncbi:YceI family protein [Candidatus Methylocalor cossyra]|uniref:Polyisoprenoid-binding protein n=1 Tax=Candidatus Methylocalor cossyra TaxID=3108543 RepID=A0ABM9NF06_9GAMM